MPKRLGGINNKVYATLPTKAADCLDRRYRAIHIRDVVAQQHARVFTQKRADVMHHVSCCGKHVKIGNSLSKEAAYGSVDGVMLAIADEDMIAALNAGQNGHVECLCRVVAKYNMTWIIRPQQRGK